MTSEIMMEILYERFDQNNENKELEILVLFVRIFDREYDLK